MKEKNIRKVVGTFKIYRVNKRFNITNSLTSIYHFKTTSSYFDHLELISEYFYTNHGK